MQDFIVFEGPDMCGKSTHIDTVIDKIRQKTGKVFAHLKFPDYNGFKGNEILDHLKNFNVANELSVYSALRILSFSTR